MSLFNSLSDGFNQFTNSVKGVVDEVSHQIHLDDPKYRRLVRDLQEGVEPIATAGKIAVCTSIVFGGIALATGSLAVLGLAGLAVCVGYNAFIIAGNVDKIAKNPSKYFSAYGVGKGLDKADLNKDLSLGTFGCNWLINGIVEGLDFFMVNDEKTIKRKLNGL